MNHTPYATMNRDTQDKDRITPSLLDLLKKSLRIHSNTTIRQDGRVQSYCGLTITETDAGCLGPLSLRAGRKTLKKAALTSAGPLSLRASRKTLKKAALTSSGVPVTYHNISPPSHQCCNCHATMWYEEREEKFKTAINLTFSLCFQGDKVLLPIFKESTCMPEVGARVFKLKLTELLDDRTKKYVFGQSEAVVYVIEFQKRGLPYAHILMWLEEHSKCKTPSEIDDIISAELPSPTDDPAGYKLVTEYMLHGPCEKCEIRSMPNRWQMSKYFPKPFLAETFLDEEGYPRYRQRDNKVTIKKGKFTYDNKHVVPHNRY
ncbi:ATP-dependent DNA helicase PIF1-like protein [Tanacetum coccineum]